MCIPASHITISEYSRKYRGWLGLAAALLVVINVLDISLTLIIGRFVDEISGEVTPDVITWCVIAYLSSALIQCVCRMSWRVLLGRTGTDLSSLVRFEAAYRAIRNPKQDVSGTSVSITQSDAENFARALDTGVIITMDAGVNCIIVPIVLFYLNPELAWKVLLPLPFLTVLARKMDKYIGSANRAVQERLSDMTGVAEEFISQARMIKANTLEVTCTERFSVKSESYRDANKKLLRLEAMFGPGLESFISLALISLMVFGVPGATTGAVSIGTFLAFYRYVEYLQWPMRAVAQAITTFRRAAISGERIRNFLHGHDAEYEAARRKYGARELDLVEQIRISNSPAPSEDHEEQVWKVKAATLSAVIGPVGSGKSTLLRRILALETVSPAGSSDSDSSQPNVTINGVNILEYSPESLRRAITLVPQESELFGLTVRENLQLGQVGEQDPSEEELWGALHIAAIDSEVRALPNGLDTVIGERGVTLSGGQRQRLSLARALLRGCQVLFLDNSLAATDSETERAILENLRLSGLCVICVTHRLSTVVACDETVILNDGKIEAVLPTGELLEAPTGWGAHFIEAQRREIAVMNAADSLVSEKMEGI